jgi:hypothetical protein
MDYVVLIDLLVLENDIDFNVPLLKHWSLFRASNH